MKLLVNQVYNKLCRQRDEALRRGDRHSYLLLCCEIAGFNKCKIATKKDMSEGRL